MTVAEMIARLQDYPSDLEVVCPKVHNGRLEQFVPYEADCFELDEAVLTIGAFGHRYYNLPRRTSDRPTDVLVLNR